MEIRKLTSDLSVSPQIEANDMADIKAAGFNAIICNRPDGEADQQPRFGTISAAAVRFEIQAVYLPIAPDGAGEADVAALKAAMGQLRPPVLAYCRTGNRSAGAWSRLAEQNNRSQVSSG